MEALPNQGTSPLATRLEELRDRIRRAEQRCGRVPGSVDLLAVVKLVPDATVAELVALGVTAVAENRVQNLLSRPSDLLAQVRMHLIGPLQTNKVRKAVAAIAEFHALDRQVLIDRLEEEAVLLGKTLPVWLQVNVAREPQKHGCAPEELAALARAAGRSPHLALRGLMTIAPLVADPEAARPHFRALAEISRNLLREGLLPPGAIGLSMGMSHDFEVAIEEGATLVRVGSALFRDVSAPPPAS